MLVFALQTSLTCAGRADVNRSSANVANDQQVASTSDDVYGNSSSSSLYYAMHMHMHRALMLLSCRM